MKPVPVASFFDEAAGLLRVCGLSVSYAGSGPSPVMALRQLDLEIAAGEVLGVLGESGCGKSTLALSILGLLPADARIEGSILFRNEELLGLPERQLRRIRGAKISLIHQEPGFALSPVMRVGDQIAEVIIAHRSLTRKARKQEVEAMLREVQLADTADLCRLPTSAERRRTASSCDCPGASVPARSDHCRRTDQISGCNRTGRDSGSTAKPKSNRWHDAHLHHSQSSLAGRICRPRGRNVCRPCG